MLQFGCISDTHAHTTPLSESLPTSPARVCHSAMGNSAGKAVPTFDDSKAVPTFDDSKAVPTFDWSSWATLEPAFNEHIQSYQTAATSASQVKRCFSWCFYLFWFCLWRWENWKRSETKKMIAKDASTTFDAAPPRPPEAPTRTLRGKPRARCGTCCTRATAPVCRRSVWRRHSSVPCGGIRGTETSSSAAALRWAASAFASRRCGPRCGGTHPSSQRCSRRRRWRHTWRRKTGTRSSAYGCGRASTNAGRCRLRGGTPKKSQSSHFFAQVTLVTSQFKLYKSHSSSHFFGTHLSLIVVIFFWTLTLHFCTFVASSCLTLVLSDIFPEHVFKHEKKQNSLNFWPCHLEGQCDSNRVYIFRLLWRGTHLGEVGDLWEIAQQFCKVWDDWPFCLISSRYLTFSWKDVVKDGCRLHFSMLSHLAIHIIHKASKCWNHVCSLLFWV